MGPISKLLKDETAAVYYTPGGFKHDAQERFRKGQACPGSGARPDP